MKRIDDLLNHLFESPTHPLYAQVDGHLRASRAYLQFVEMNRDKIRKKLRISQEGQAALNLGVELATAYALLQDVRLTLEYEKYIKQRGPDFTVTFRTHTPFNVEVTRIRSMEAGQTTIIESPSVDKLMHVLCEKVGQMQVGMMNVLLIVLESPEMTPDDLPRAALRLKQMADQKSDAQAQAYFVAQGFKDNAGAEFLRQYRNLSAVVVHQADRSPNLVWQNAMARHPLIKELKPILEKLFGN